MKIKILSLTVVLLLFISCKKDHPTITTINKNSPFYKINFKAGFNQKISSTFATGRHLSSLTSSAIDTNMVNNMIFAVYDSVGNFVSKVDQIAADTLFGSANFSLQAGKYTCVIAGCGGLNPLQLMSLSPVNGDEQPPTNLNIDYLSIFYDGNADSNTFYKKINFTVSNTNINQSVALDRIVSKVTIVIKGGLPPSTVLAQYSAVANITNGATDRFMVGSSSPGSSLGSVNVMLQHVTNASQYGTGNYVLSAVVLASSVSLDIIGGTVFGGYGTPSKITAERKITATCLPNTETILTGDLFNMATNNSNSVVNIDTTWKPQVITGSFGN